MPDPPPWRYRCHVTEDGADTIRFWYERQSQECRRKFLVRTQALRGLPLREWELPLFRWLRGDGQGLGEVRFKADRVQQRILGFRGPESDLFTFLYPAKEQSGRFIPRNAIEITQDLKSAVLANKDRSNEFWLFPDPKPKLPPGTGRQGFS
jgi:hypothetical protein